MPAVDVLARGRWLRSVRRVAAIVLGFLALETIGVGVFYGLERSTLKAWALRHDESVPAAPVRIVFFSPGLATPPTFNAGEASLKDDEPVIGIEAGGKTRAYHLRSMLGRTSHIVNDLLGDVAVTVTYCDISDCAQAFGGDAALTPLDVSQGGLLEGEMVVRVGTDAYLQKTGEVVDERPGETTPPFPYATFPLTRTTWGEWKAQFPESDVFLTKAEEESNDATKATGD